MHLEKKTWLFYGTRKFWNAAGIEVFLHFGSYAFIKWNRFIALTKGLLVESPYDITNFIWNSGLLIWSLKTLSTNYHVFVFRCKQLIELFKAHERLVASFWWTPWKYFGLSRICRYFICEIEGTSFTATFQIVQLFNQWNTSNRMVIFD